MTSIKKLILLVFLGGCSQNPSYDSRVEGSPRLKVGECYHTNGDVGGLPGYEIYCVQATGKDGFLRCEGSSSWRLKEFSWDFCKWPISWDSIEWKKSLLQKIACPVSCPPP